MPCSSRKALERRQHRAGGALIDAAAARDIGAGAEMIGIDEAVIGRVRRAEHREALRVLLPGKLAAVDDDAAHGRAVAAHELGQRMHHDVGAVLDRPQQDRRRDRVVDDQRHAVPVRDVGERLDVADVAGRIADALAEQRAGLVVDQLLDGGGVSAAAKRTSMPWRGSTWANSVWVVP